MMATAASPRAQLHLQKILDSSVGRHGASSAKETSYHSGSAKERSAFWSGGAEAGHPCSQQSLGVEPVSSHNGGSEAVLAPPGNEFWSSPDTSTRADMECCTPPRREATFSGLRERGKPWALGENTEGHSSAAPERPLAVRSATGRSEKASVAEIQPLNRASDRRPPLKKDFLSLHHHQEVGPKPHVEKRWIRGKVSEPGCAPQQTGRHDDGKGALPPKAASLGMRCGSVSLQPRISSVLTPLTATGLHGVGKPSGSGCGSDRKITRPATSQEAPQSPERCHGITVTTVSICHQCSQRNFAGEFMALGLEETRRRSAIVDLYIDTCRWIINAANSILQNHFLLRISAAVSQVEKFFRVPPENALEASDVHLTNVHRKPSTYIPPQDVVEHICQLPILALANYEKLVLQSDERDAINNSITGSAVILPETPTFHAQHCGMAGSVSRVVAGTSSAPRYYSRLNRSTRASSPTHSLMSTSTRCYNLYEHDDDAFSTTAAAAALLKLEREDIEHLAVDEPREEADFWKAEALQARAQLQLFSRLVSDIISVDTHSEQAKCEQPRYSTNSASLSVSAGDPGRRAHCLNGEPQLARIPPTMVTLGPEPECDAILTALLCSHESKCRAEVEELERVDRSVVVNGTNTLIAWACQALTLHHKPSSDTDFSRFEAPTREVTAAPSDSKTGKWLTEPGATGGAASRPTRLGNQSSEKGDSSRTVSNGDRPTESNPRASGKGIPLVSMWSGQVRHQAKPAASGKEAERLP